METGLYYLQSRYYNPQWGRFINADDPELLKIFAGSDQILAANLFAYALNNPIMNTDPTGQFASVVASALVGAILAAMSYWLEYKIGMRGWNEWLFAGYIALGATLGAAGAYFRYWAQFTNLAVKIASSSSLMAKINVPIIKAVIIWGSYGMTFAIKAIAKSFTRYPGESWGKFFKRSFGWS